MVDSPSVSSLVSWAATAPATVISSPSRIQATPRAMTIRVWNGDQGSRSIRAGMRLRMAPGAGADASWVVVIERLRAGVAEVPPPPTRRDRTIQLNYLADGDSGFVGFVSSPTRVPPRGSPTNAGVLPAGDITCGASNGRRWACSGHAPARAPRSPERGPRPRPGHPDDPVRRDHRAAPTGWRRAGRRRLPTRTCS